MKAIVIVIASLFSLAHADVVKIDVQPEEAVYGDSVNITFKIESKDNQEPQIQFSPDGIKVDSKNFSGRSTRTTFFNGKLQTESTMNYTYQMTPEKTGNVYLKDIEVKVGDQVYKHPNLRIRVLKKPRNEASVFLKAETTKDQLFIGESVIVNYYVYYVVGLQSFTIKKFPKLNNFLKRYQPERNVVERVGVGNKVYQRRLLYSAQLFPEKPGKLKIDSMSLKVQYIAGRNNPFGSFGINIGPRSIQTKDLKSETVYLDVLPLPTVNVPKGFTGLVGKHTFDLQINKTKFLLNEPLEIKLKVNGPGALENLDAPSILSNAGLEEFDIKSNLELADDFTGTKTFEYVYLTRAPFEEQEKKISLAYFDPEDMKYVTQDLTLPAIQVVGQALVNKGSNIDTKSASLPKRNENFENDGSLIIAPVISSKPFITLPRVNLGLLIVILISFIIKNKQIFIRSSNSTKKALIKEFLNGDLSYAKLMKILKTYNQDFKTFKDYIDHSHHDKKTKEYLLDLLAQCEKKEFSHGKNLDKAKLKVKKKYLKKFINVLENG